MNLNKYRQNWISSKDGEETAEEKINRWKENGEHSITSKDEAERQQKERDLNWVLKNEKMRYGNIKLIQF
jgi:hypothetical protein